MLVPRGKRGLPHTLNWMPYERNGTASPGLQSAS